MANSYKGDGRSPDSRNDCAVISIAYAFNIPYQQAYDLCKENGREHNKGFDPRKVIHNGDGRHVSYHKKKMFFLNKFVEYYDRPEMSVKSFKYLYKKGTYLVRVGGHVFTIINGDALNNFNDKAKISWYLKITDRVI